MRWQSTQPPPPLSTIAEGNACKGGAFPCGQRIVVSLLIWATSIAIQTSGRAVGEGDNYGSRPLEDPTGALPIGLRWNVSNRTTGVDCLLLEARMIQFLFTDRDHDMTNSTDTEELTAEFGLPTVSGLCTSLSASLKVLWQSKVFPGQFLFTMDFLYRHSDGLWDAQRFSHSANGGREYHYSEDGYFRSPLHSAFFCRNRSTVSRFSDARTSFIDIRVQAFPFANRFSPSKVECPGSNNSASTEKLGFVIGLSVGSIVIVAAIAVLLARCVKPIDYKFEVST